jgi:hypothetical protein
MGSYIDFQKLTSQSDIYPNISLMYSVPVKKIKGIKEQNDLNIKISNWITENISSIWTRISKSHSSYIYFYFENISDAMIFKLVWGNV